MRHVVKIYLRCFMNNLNYLSQSTRDSLKKKQSWIILWLKIIPTLAGKNEYFISKIKSIWISRIRESLWLVAVFPVPHLFKIPSNTSIFWWTLLRQINATTVGPYLCQKSECELLVELANQALANEGDESSPQPILSVKMDRERDKMIIL